MRERFLVLLASNYSFKDDDSGRLIEGTKIEYVDPANPLNEVDRKGTAVAKATLPFDAFVKFPEVPGLYDIDFKVAVVQGKMSLTPTDATLVRAFDLRAFAASPVTAAPSPASNGVGRGS